MQITFDALRHESISEMIGSDQVYEWLTIKYMAQGNISSLRDHKTALKGDRFTKYISINSPAAI